ncbi:hypothetical protein [Psychrobacter cryohalolentis]|uniref:hypothetical protein n=1 Tax=Psychrobacter cryohalolentis TaxID=330922 RepID=UPI003F857CDA
MSEQWYFGEVDYTPRPHTRISGIAKAVDGKWKKQTLASDLAPVGRVFAPSLYGVAEKQFLIFTVKLNPRINKDSNYLSDKEHDHYIIEKSERPTVVIDYRHMSTEEIRYRLVEFGLGSIDAIDAEPNQVIVALSDTECAIVEIMSHPRNGRYVAKTRNVEVYSFNSAIFDGDAFKGQFIKIPDVTVGDFIRAITWKLDVDILNDLLAKLRDYDEYLKTTTKKQRADLVSLLDRALNITKQEDWVDTHEWLEGYKQRVARSLIEPEQVVDTLSNMQPFQQKLEIAQQAASNAYRQKIQPIIEQEIRSELADLSSQQESLKQNIQKKHDILENKKVVQDELQQKISSLNQQLLAEIGHLNQTLGDIKELDSQENISLVDRLKRALHDQGKLIDPADTTFPPWSRGSGRDDIPYIDNSEFDAKLQAFEEKTAISQSELSLFDRALRSGDFVLLPSISAEILIPKYAEIVTGGVTFRESLGPNILNLDDLWMQPNQGTKTGFARAWSTAVANPNQYHLVWLDGLQRTAIDLWLPSLISVLYSSERPSNLLVMATIDDNFIDQERLWPELPRFSTPLKFDNQVEYDKRLLQRLSIAQERCTQLAYQKVSVASENYSEILEKGQLWLKELLDK